MSLTTHRSTRLFTPIAAALLATVAISPALAGDYRFDDAEAIDKAFVRTGYEKKLAHDAEAGVGGGGALVASDSGFQGQIVEKLMFDGGEPTIVIAVDFQHREHKVASGQPLFVGFGPGEDYEPNLADSDGAGDHHIVVALQGFEQPGQYRLLIQSKTAGKRNNKVHEAFKLEPGQWYRLTLSAVSGDAGYTVTGAVAPLDDAGNPGPALSAFTRDQPLSVPPLRADQTVHAFVGGQGHMPQRGIGALDNFTTPAREPIAQRRWWLRDVTALPPASKPDTTAAVPGRAVLDTSRLS